MNRHARHGVAELAHRGALDWPRLVLGAHRDDHLVRRERGKRVLDRQLDVGLADGGLCIVHRQLLRGVLGLLARRVVCLLVGREPAQNTLAHDGHDDLDAFHVGAQLLPQRVLGILDRADDEHVASHGRIVPSAMRC